MLGVDHALPSLFGTNVSFSSLAMFFAILVTIRTIIVLPIYRIFFHPLRKYPGPKLWAASSLPWGFAFHHGYYHDIILALHRKYGRIIRIGPNQLSYDIPEAWDDIYSRSKHHAENPKPKWYLDPARNEVVGAKEKDHIRMRGLLAKGFTGSAMLAQEPLIKQNVDLLFRRFGENIQSGDNVLDMFEWFSYCTFDIIGDLTFGETFGCLKNSMMHPWLATVFANVKLAHTLVLCKRIPFFFFYLPVVETYKLWRDSGKFEVTIQEVISKHLGKEVEDESKMDFLGIMKMKKKTQYMHPEEIHANAAFITLAGSETTSTVMAVVVHMICTHPAVYRRILTELHSTFANEDEIDMRSANQLVYLMAVIEESMRLHPPGPNALWRVAPKEGNFICGQWVSGSTILDIPHRAMYRSEHNFHRADEFLPERWLAVEEASKDRAKQNAALEQFKNDRRDCFHPFSYGPRQCLAVR